MASDGSTAMGDGQKPAHDTDGTPQKSTKAILKDSAPVPDGVPQVSGIDFDGYEDRDMNVIDLLSSMENMGFQASAYFFAP